MHHRRSARVIAATLLACALGLSAGPAAASASAAASRRCPPDVRQSVTEAYDTVFARTGAATVNERAVRLQDGTDPLLAAILTAWVADPSGNTTTVALRRLRCEGTRRASAVVDVVLSGTTLEHLMPRGRAVLEDGTWKVARTTFCARMALENPSLAAQGACAATRS